MNGKITWSTIKNPLTGDGIEGKAVDDILYPEDAKGLKMSLFRAVTEHNYQWFVYAVMDQGFLALIEFLKKEETFLIHEAKIINGSEENMTYLKKMLWGSSGQYYKQFKGNGTE